MGRLARVAVGVFVCAGLASAAAAQPIMTFTFSDLSGSFAADLMGGGVFTAEAVAAAPLSTSGDVTKLVGPGAGTATFLEGDFPGPGDAEFTINVSGIMGTTALGAGTFTLTDVDGDTITGSIAGGFSLIGGFFIAFNGTLSNVMLNNVSVDGTFDGNMGSFDTSFPGMSQPFNGAAVAITFSSAGGLFTQNFERVSTLVSAQIVPAPGALALAGLGGLIAARRRRG